MSEVVQFSEHELRLFRQRMVVAPLLVAIAVAGAALAAAGIGGPALTIVFVALLVILGIGTVATEYATRLTRFDPLLDDARMTRVSTLRITRRVLRSLVYGLVIALAWWKGLRGDLALIALFALAAIGVGLYAQLLFHKEVALLRPVARLEA